MSQLSAASQTIKCRTCGETDRNLMASSDSKLRHLCVACIRKALKDSEALSAKILGYTKHYGLPSFAINELAEKELARHH